MLDEHEKLAKQAVEELRAAMLDGTASPKRVLEILDSARSACPCCVLRIMQGETCEKPQRNWLQDFVSRFKRFMRHKRICVSRTRRKLKSVDDVKIEL